MEKKKTGSHLPNSKTEKGAKQPNKKEPKSKQPKKKEPKSKQPEKKEPKSATTSSKAADEHANRFPVQIINGKLVQKFTGGTVKKEAAVLITSVLEYLSAEILELSANVARNRSKSQDGVLKVTLADILEAIETDPEMKKLTAKIVKLKSDGEK